MHGSIVGGLRHLAYAAGWKKFEPLWDLAIRARRAGMMLPLLETILSEFGRRASSAAPVHVRPATTSGGDGDRDPSRGGGFARDRFAMRAVPEAESPGR